MLTDSACDIPKDMEQELNIRIMCFPVTVDGKGYRERIDFSNRDFYTMMKESKEFPTTSQVTWFEILENYKQLFSEGYTDVIHVSISSTGSSTYQGALMARENFYDEVEGSASMRIHIVDSANYTAVYGYPVMQSAMKIQRGGSVDEILSYLEEWFSCAEVYFAPYTLSYCKRSGRISAAAAFAGELLGLRPVIRIAAGVSSVYEKVRGDKNILPKLVQIAEKNMIPHTPYVIMQGENPERAEELEKLLTKKLGYPPEWTCEIGAAVASNCGPDVAGFVAKINKRT